MRKELIWAAVIGISFGLIIAFGAWRISSKNSEVIQTSASPTPVPVVSEFKITLDKPENNDVVTQNSTTVTGITKPLAWITVSGEKGDYIIQSDEKGTFIQDVDLISGVNQIMITAFDPTGSQSIQKVLVVYSSAFEIATVATPQPGVNSTESAIRAKVQQKVAEAMNKPKGYLGVVTDIADSTIQIKTEVGEIKQISTNSEQVTTVNAKGTTSKIVKLTDIAIGDFIVAMGYINSSSVLAAQRILITNPVTEPEIVSNYGKVTETTKKTVTVGNLKDGQVATITPNAKTDILTFASGKLTNTKITGINTGDLVIHITDSSSDLPTTRSVFIVQKAN